MDRLHYERDPCVKFDPDRKLWTYRHRLRNPDDFLPDGTSSVRQGLKRKGFFVDGDEGAGGQWGEAELGGQEDEDAEGDGGGVDWERGSAVEYNKREAPSPTAGRSLQRNSYSHDHHVTSLHDNHKGAQTYGENDDGWDKRTSKANAKSNGPVRIRFKFPH